MTRIRRQSRHAPMVAICGIGLRLPQGVRDTDAFWEVLVNGKDLRSHVPESRYNRQGFANTLGKKGAIETQCGYFVDEDLGSLDTSLFSMSRKELERCDPQQRQFLEVVREALENAGEVNYRGKAVGCYVGTFSEHWLQMAAREQQHAGGYLLTGHGDLMIANRASYEYDLKGPSMVIKTGCSASLVGLHEACRALQNGDCVGAIVGGVNLIMGPTTTAAMTEEGMLSPEGSCKTFDAAADGYGRGEAINAVYIKLLDDAIRDNNPIRAIIRASGTNSDGNSSTLLTPNSAMHEALMRKVYLDAGLDPSKTAFVEVKPNVGHSEGASGLTSLIKAVLALENNTIPPNIKFYTPNPKIPFEDKKLVVPTKPVAWPADRDRRISVNSFGIGGSNAHVILEAPPAIGLQTTTIPSVRPNGPRLLLASANTARSAKTAVENIQQYLSQHPAVVDDAAYTLALHRDHLPQRAFMVASADGRILETSSVIKAPNAKPKLLMIFTGQGAQWPNMGKELVQTDEGFKRDLSAMDKILKGLPHPPTWNIEDELMAPQESSKLHTAALSQPICTALQIAMVNYLRRAGIRPDAVVGHSSGEIAAAYAANLMSLDEAIVSAYYRGYVTSCTSMGGGMGAVGLGVDQVAPYISGLEKVVIACDNSPQSVTLSGDVDVLDKVLDRIQRDRPDTLARRLKVDMAYHSQHMEHIADLYEQLLLQSLPAVVTRGKGEKKPSGVALLPMFSSVTNSVITSPSELGPSYWVSNLVSRVRFSGAVQTFLAEQQPGSAVFLEVGPHSALAGPLRQIVGAGAGLGRDEGCRYVSALIRGRDARHTMLAALGQLYQNNVSADWSAVVVASGSRSVLTNLPRYPWDHSGGSFWYESRLSKEFRMRQVGHHSLLGLRIHESSPLEPLWRNKLTLVGEPWLAHHKIRTDAVFPFAGYLAMAGEAVRQHTGIESGYQVRDASVHSAMMLSDEEVEIVTSLRPRRLTKTTDSSWFEFCIVSYNGVGWTKHCDGQVRACTEKPPVASPRPDPETMVRRVGKSQWYENMDNIGIVYGPEFQSLTDIASSVTNNVATAVVQAGEDRAADPAFPLHPVIIDVALQLILVAMVQGVGRRFGPLKMPTTIKELTVFRGSPVMDAFSWAPPRGGENEVGVEITSGGNVVLRLRGLELKQVDNDGGGGSNNTTSLLLQESHAAARLEWVPLFDMVDHATLFTPPLSIQEDTILQEKMTLLCILESGPAVHGLEACNWHFDKFRDWLAVEINRAENGTYPVLGAEDVKTLVSLPSADRRVMIDHLCRVLAKDSPKGALALCTKRVFDNVRDVFVGRTDPLDLLMQGNLLTRVYDCISYGKGDFFKLFSNARPNCRILEIGGGTGGTTEMILRHIIRPGGLPAYDTYTFTDISAGFFPQARERFAYAPNMEFKALDISRPPFEQGGFEPDSYDIILAPNVIHATKSIRDTLGNLYPLLRPGGMLVMTELCALVRTPNYSFGTFAGWWLGQDDGRPLEPYISLERWDDELKACGFSGVDTAVLDDEEPYQYCAAIVSTKPVGVGSSGGNDPAASTAASEFAARTIEKGTKSAGSSNRHPEVTVLVVDRTSSLAKGVVAQLERDGFQVSVFTLSEDAAIPHDRDVVSLLDVESFFFQDITAERWAAFQKILQKHEAGNILWVTKPAQVNCKDPRSAQALGVARSVRAESKVPFYTLEVAKAAEAKSTELLSKVLCKIRNDADATNNGLLASDMEYVIDDGVIKVGRYQPFSLMEELRQISTKHPAEAGSRVVSMTTSLQTKHAGSLENLVWVSKEVAQPDASGLGDDEVVIDTRAVGLNFKDVLFAMGVLRPSGGETTVPLGLEIAGVVTGIGRNITGLAVGDRVMAMPPTSCFQTVITTPADLVERISDDITFAEAATIPVVFSTVIESLINIGQLEKGQIYATVGSEAKAQYLVETFGIARDHIFNSRDASFAVGLKKATSGRGVDVVLNSVSGELLHASWECVATFGKMIELGKRDIIEEGSLNMRHFLANRSYCCVDLTLMCQERPQRARGLLKRCTELLKAGAIKPLNPMSTFEASNVQDAFRWVQESSHIGKAVVMMPEHIGSQLESTPESPPLSMEDKASYLITGGLGGLGVPIATWLVERGAKSLVFLSRTAGQKPKDRALIAELEAAGCSVVCVAGHAESPADVQKAISFSPHPIRGVLHLAMVLRDAPIASMAYDDWLAANNPKIGGAWALHEAFKKTPLDFFVMASSLVTVVEQPGQGNYSAANTFLEAFTQYRRGLGLPASILNICPIDGVGFVAENQFARKNMKAQGLYFLREPELLDFLELAIKLSPASVRTRPPRCPTTAAAAHESREEKDESGWQKPWVSTGQVIMGLRSEEDLNDPNTRTNWRRDRRMGFYHNFRDSAELGHDSGQKKSSGELTKFLAAAADSPALLTTTESAEFLAKEIGSKVYDLMLKDDAEVDTSLTLQQLGLDSLMAIELRRWWKVAFGLEISVLEILAASSLERLGKVAALGLIAKFKQG
ncbi:Compactin diketide synthase mokB [Colletotrichum higginsianum]|uniref:Compactin diketide synthase mokB n=1 Tax=Colletotrichum higginsianum TaxID=80884 RepID=A0A4T0WI13_9PEZI|nr:Compactin diketide synthase mokB [Colletotrichum higginsianum]